MATPAEIAAAIAVWSAAFPRAKAPLGGTLVIWHDRLRHVDADTLAAVATDLVADEDTFPKLTTVLARVRRRAPKAARGDASGCPDCAAFPGFRCLALHWIHRDGRARVTQITAACDCVLGAEKAGVLSFAVVLSTWGRLARCEGRAPYDLRDCVRVLDSFCTSSLLPVLGSDHTLTKAERDALRAALAAKPRGGALLAAAFRGVADPRAGERSRDAAGDRDPPAEAPEADLDEMPDDDRWDDGPPA